MILHIPLEIKLRPELIDRLADLINTPGVLPDYDSSLLARMTNIEDQHIAVNIHINNDQNKNLEVRCYRSGESLGETVISLLNRNLDEKFLIGIVGGLAIELQFVPSTEEGV